LQPRLDQLSELLGSAKLWPAFFVRADGITIGRLRRNVPGVLVSTVDTDQELYDSTALWRERAMVGTLYSGTPVSDSRSDDRTRS
jgi:hypothetical protein